MSRALRQGRVTVQFQGHISAVLTWFRQRRCTSIFLHPCGVSPTFPFLEQKSLRPESGCQRAAPNANEESFPSMPAKRRGWKASKVLVHKAYKFKFGTHVLLVESIPMLRIIFWSSHLQKLIHGPFPSSWGRWRVLVVCQLQILWYVWWRLCRLPSGQRDSFTSLLLLRDNQFCVSREKMPTFPKLPFSEVGNHKRIPDGKPGKWP